ncbi:MAG: threonine--tRNA ligase [Candidatus Pacebacteria bacterium]|nr:threonine--tRNA ligase [Candidatus Paceibacterota bacterium]
MEKIRHSLAHILAIAVKQLFPKAILGTGPCIENGFYYDFLMPKNFSEKDLESIEKRMKEIIKKDISFERKIITKTTAKKIFKKEPFKLDLLKEIKKEITTYQSNEFIDLCSGPHVKNTKEINPRAFKLSKIAGAYWKGNEKNQMLTRIYGIAFKTEKELKNYLSLLEETEKRDHRKLGQQLDLFCFSDLVGPGLPMYTPKGTILIEELKKNIESICKYYGFEKVITPHLAKIDLYKISGHADKFKEELFHVSSEKKHEFVIKPVQCPHQTQIYASKIRSYKDLPIRYMESEKQYRAEKTGEVGGLNRVYAITVEDGHSFCQVSQVKEEVKQMVKIIKKFYQSLGLWKNHKVYLSFRDYQHPEKYIGDKKDWDKCELILKQINKEMKLNAEIKQGEAALYGPKIDFMFKDALGKEIQIPTVQIDFATAKRFNLSYISETGKKVSPVMVHRAILGSYERFLALLIEHFAGAFPFWLSPIQISIIPIGEKHIKYAKQIKEKLKEYRVEINLEKETVSKKIRQAELQKTPFIVVVGDKEIKAETISLRSRKEKEIKEIKLKDFLNLCQNYQSKQKL